ncbi:MAG: hypothetical protein ABMA15_10435 [Vicinamibacterales bacterium]
MRGRQVIDSTPAMRFTLITGGFPGSGPDGEMDPASAGLYGWYSLQTDFHYDIGHAWACGPALTTHRAAATAEAKQCGFVAWCLNGTAPSGPKFEAWRRAFLAEHGRRS